MEETLQSLKTLLEQLCALPGVSGQEEEAAQGAAKLLERYCSQVETDQNGNVIGVFHLAQFGQPTILLDAHLDQIGLTVTGHEPGGFLRVAPCGGMDRRILAAQPVAIQGKDGWLPGVAASTPPHLSKASERETVPEITDLLIDTGLTQAQAEQQIPLGSRVILSAPLRSLAKDRVTASALDDRAGAAAVLGVLMLLEHHKEELRCGVTVLLSAGEEVNAFGAKTAGYRLNPDEILAVDVSFARQPGVAQEKCGKLGAGPMIGFSPTLTPRISRRLVELAQKENIPYQREIMGGSTGTNADSLSLVRGGRYSGLVSIPQRNMHTPAEIVSMADVENTAKLLAAYLREVESNG